MKSMFEAACVEEVKQRLEALKPNQPRQWGKMNPAQMLAHCSLGLEMAAGEIRPPRALIGRILGPVIKPMALRDNEPMRRNSPTMKELIVAGDDKDFETERNRLSRLIDRFAASGCYGLHLASACVFRLSNPRRMGGPDVQASGSSFAAVRRIIQRYSLSALRPRAMPPVSSTGLS